MPARPKLVFPLGRDVGIHISTREIWSLTWPQALTMFFQFMIGFTDVFVAGRIHPHLQGALGIVTQCQFFLQVFGIALVNGGLAAMSQALGAGLSLRAQRYAWLLIKAGVVFSLATLALGYVFATDLLLFLRVPQSIYDLTLELWLMQLPILPASYLAFVTMAVFRSHKIVRVPLISIVIVCLVNLVADLGLGLGWFGLPRLGAVGIVISSIISVSCGGFFNLAVLIRKGLLGIAGFAPLRWEKRAIGYVVKVALPAGGTQLLWHFGYLVLFLITNTLPRDSVVAVNGLTAGLRVEGLLFLPAMAFSFTGSILVGHCLGAGDAAEAKRVGLRVTGVGAAAMSLLALGVFPFISGIMAFVSPDLQVQKVAESYIFYNLLAMPFSVVSMTMSGLFSGAGATVYSLAAFSIGTWMVRLPLAWYMGHVVWESASGIFLAMLVSQVVQAGLSMYLFLFRDWSRFASTARRMARPARRDTLKGQKMSYVNNGYTPVSFEDMPRYLEILGKNRSRASDYSFANLWGWSTHYSLEWRFDGPLCWIRQKRPLQCNWAPVGPWDEVADWGIYPEMAAGARFIRVPGRLCETWAEAFADRIVVEEDRDQWDYIYLASELCSLSGNRFHKKKNLLRQFMKTYAYEYKSLSEEDVGAVLDMQAEWCRWRDCESSEALLAENDAVARVLVAWNRIPGLCGGIIRIDNIPVAYTLAESLSEDTLVIHFEKAANDIKGGYQAINYLFCNDAGKNFTYINREQDLGDEGLRQAKVSYNPVDFTRKCSVLVL